MPKRTFFRGAFWMVSNNVSLGNQKLCGRAFSAPLAALIFSKSSCREGSFVRSLQELSTGFEFCALALMVTRTAMKDMNGVRIDMATIKAKNFVKVETIFCDAYLYTDRTPPVRC